jgi:hypothetical protein
MDETPDHDVEKQSVLPLLTYQRNVIGNSFLEKGG